MPRHIIKSSFAIFRKEMCVFHANFHTTAPGHPDLFLSVSSSPVLVVDSTDRGQLVWGQRRPLNKRGCVPGGLHSVEGGELRQSHREPPDAFGRRQPDGSRLLRASQGLGKPRRPGGPGGGLDWRSRWNALCAGRCVEILRNHFPTSPRGMGASWFFLLTAEEKVQQRGDLTH